MMLAGLIIVVVSEPSLRNHSCATVFGSRVVVERDYNAASVALLYLQTAGRSVDRRSGAGSVSPNPIKVPRRGRGIALMFGTNGRNERSGEIYLPYVGHLRIRLSFSKTAQSWAMAHVRGLPFEMEDVAIRNARCRAFNTLLRNIADDSDQYVLIWSDITTWRCPRRGTFIAGLL